MTSHQACVPKSDTIHFGKALNRPSTHEKKPERSLNISSAKERNLFIPPSNSKKVESSYNSDQHIQKLEERIQALENFHNQERETAIKKEETKIQNFIKYIAWGGEERLLFITGMAFAISGFMHIASCKMNPEKNCVPADYTADTFDAVGGLLSIALGVFMSFYKSLEYKKKIRLHHHSTSEEMV